MKVTRSAPDLVSLTPLTVPLTLDSVSASDNIRAFCCAVNLLEGEVAGDVG